MVNREAAYRLIWLFVVTLFASPVWADQRATAVPRNQAAVPSKNILSANQWSQLDRTVDQGLVFLARQQQPNGSFIARPAGQPGITSLCVMAFLSRGHVPGQGPYGEQIDRAIKFVLATQGNDGLFSYISRQQDAQLFIKAAVYNHGITTLMLGEVYGMTASPLNAQIRTAIPKAIDYTRKLQFLMKTGNGDQGGWRYLRTSSRGNSDLSVTSWQLMGLRSARNAEFSIPKEYIDDAMAFVRRCYDPGKGAFLYRVYYVKRPGQPSWGVVGGGIVSLSLGGEHETEMAQRAGAWVLKYPLENYNRVQRYHYGAFYCSQAMFQLGGHYWKQFYPRLMRTLVNHQRRDGSWDAETGNDGSFGNVYTSALCVLALSPPYQILPIYQR
jgi:hypothetical protein